MRTIFMIVLCFILTTTVCSAKQPTYFVNLINQAAAAGQKTVTYKRCVGDENHFCSKTTDEQMLVFGTKTDWQPIDEPKIKDLHGTVKFIGTEYHRRVPSGELDQYGDPRLTWEEHGKTDHVYGWWAVNGEVHLSNIPNWEVDDGPTNQIDFEPYKGKYLKRRYGDTNQYYVPVKN